jgi:2-polyprenyl-3-methyl-5-hydroxy-6-metoxy-1,4-benzoquinol methylase
MSIGMRVRKALGPLERPISAFYRGMFINLGAFIHQAVVWVPEARNILEIGGGEGAVTEHLQTSYPGSAILSIDIMPEVGRMYRGNSENVVFREQTIQDLAASSNDRYDLMILSDVMHHVPWDMHVDLLKCARKLLTDKGVLVLKDWKPSWTPIHFLCWASDTYITGDNVRYKTEQQFRELLFEVFGEESIQAEATVKPWRSNVAFLVRNNRKQEASFE